MQSLARPCVRLNETPVKFFWLRHLCVDELEPCTMRSPAQRMHLEHDDIHVTILSWWVDFGLIYTSLYTRGYATVVVSYANHIRSLYPVRIEQKINSLKMAI